MMAPQSSRSLFSRVLGLWAAYLRGQLLVSALIGGLTWVVSAAIGLPHAAVLGALAGVFETIPSLGPLVAIIPAVVVAFWKGSSVIPVENWVFALIVIGVYVAIQQVGNLIIQPHVMGREMRLPPLLVLVCVLGGAAVAGVVGALLAVPLAATVKEIYLHLRQKRAS